MQNQNVVEYRKNLKRIIQHTERKYWVNELQRRPWFTFPHNKNNIVDDYYTYTASVLNIGLMVSWVKPKKSINLILFIPKLFKLV